MKKWSILVILCIVFSACDSENANDCIQTKGKTIKKEISISTFNKITIYGGIKLMLTYGEEQKIELETGENLANDIHFTVEENHLKIKNENRCNYVRDYEDTKVSITLPNLEYLRNGSQFSIESTNELPFKNIQLISEDNNEAGVYNNGDFKLQLISDKITIVNNNLSHYFLSGKVEDLQISFYNGDGRVEAENLIAEHVTVFHRGSNKIIVNPQQSLIGELVSTGNLIAKNRPPVVDVKQAYTGKLIIED